MTSLIHLHHVSTLSHDIHLPLDFFFFGGTWFHFFSTGIDTSATPKCLDPFIQRGILQSSSALAARSRGDYLSAHCPSLLFIMLTLHYRCLNPHGTTCFHFLIPSGFFQLPLHESFQLLLHGFFQLLSTWILRTISHRQTTSSSKFLKIISTFKTSNESPSKPTNTHFAVLFGSDHPEQPAPASYLWRASLKLLDNRLGLAPSCGGFQLELQDNQIASAYGT